MIVLEHNDEEMILRIFNYLREQKLDYTEYHYNEDTGLYVIACPDSEVSTVLREITDFAENGSELTKVQSQYVLNSISKLLDDSKPDEGAKVYVNIRERYDDMRSSANSFMFVSILGFVFLGLALSGKIPFAFGTLFYVMCFIMFSGFFIGGIISYKKAAQLKALIPTEEALADRIRAYLLEEYTPLAVSPDDSASEEELYFSRIEDMRSAVKAHFSDADDLLIEGMMEDVFSDIYPTENE